MTHMVTALTVSLSLVFSTGRAADAPIGVIGPQTVDASDVEAAAQDVFKELQGDFEAELKQLRLTQARARHSVLERELERFLDERALDLEAAARGISKDALRAGIKIPPVSDTEIQAFYKANRPRINQPYAEVATDIRNYLAADHQRLAAEAFHAQLRRKHDIRSMLEPRREMVDAVGPSIGAQGAPVTIVEFADFQCPYCAQSTSVLKALLAKYPQDLRLVFRHLPLVDIHDNALQAARAAVCAERQGKFWPVHDALFLNQDALEAPALDNMVRAQGVDMDRQSKCVAEAATMDTIDADSNAAFELGISSTPAFLVNGRLIVGSASMEELDDLIQDELRRARAGGRH
jgi:predicted DsbA family dithiol-disulfide isomerase